MKLRLAGASLSLLVSSTTAFAYECTPDDSPVHVVIGKETTLYRQPFGKAQEKICDGPCEADVPLCDIYWVGGRGIKTRQILLHARPGDTVSIKSDGFEREAKSIGAVMLGAGVAGVGASLVLGLVIVMRGLGGEDVSTLNSVASVSFATGLAIGATGGALLIAGSASSSVRQEVRTMPAAPVAHFPFSLSVSF